MTNAVYPNLGGGITQAELDAALLPFEQPITAAQFSDAVSAYPAIDQTITGGRVAAPLIAASTHGKGTSPMAEVCVGGALPTTNTERVIHIEANGDIVLLMDTGSQVDCTVKVRR